MVRRKFCSQRARAHCAAVELQKESVFASSRAKQPISIRSHAAVNARGCIPPLRERPIAMSAGRACDGDKHRVAANGVGGIGKQRPAGADRCPGAATRQAVISNRGGERQARVASQQAYLRLAIVSPLEAELASVDWN
jgi:hypothetical protein